jgi:putative acetyltransferase
MNVRRATEHDCYAISRIHAAAIRAVGSPYTPEQIDSWSANITPEAYLPYMATRDFLVAIDDGSVIGFAEFHREAGEVGAVYVHPARQRRGAGHLLMSEIERIAGEAGIPKLKVIASLNAVPFYAACGFVLLEESTYRTRGGVEMACAIMGKSLASALDDLRLSRQP